MAISCLICSGSGVPTRKKEEQSPVSRLFEYLGPAQNKLPLQTAKQTAATYPSQAVHTPQSAEQELCKKAAQHLEADALCHLPDKVGLGNRLKSTLRVNCIVIHHPQLFRLVSNPQIFSLHAPWSMGVHVYYYFGDFMCQASLRSL